MTPPQRWRTTTSAGSIPRVTRRHRTPSPLQAWINTTTTSGGQIFGFGDVQTGNSRPLGPARLHGQRRAASVRRLPDNGSPHGVERAPSYNDGQWHMITATRARRDGAVRRRCAGRPPTDITTGEAYVGYWRVGGDNLGGWPEPAEPANFAGDIDEVAVYPTVLTRTRSSPSTGAVGRTSPIPPAPADAYGAAVYNDEPDLYWRLGEPPARRPPTPARRSTTAPTTRRRAGRRPASSPATPRPRSTGTTGSSPRTRVLQPDRTTRGGVVQDHHDRGRQDHRLRQQPDRQLRQLRPARLHAGQRPARLRRLDRPGQHDHHGPAYNDGQWHHVVATQPARHEALRRRRLVGTNPQTGARTTPATGGSAVTTPGARPARTSTAASTRSRSTRPC